MKERVLITGAGTGLGRESALHLAKHGFEVYAGVLTMQQQEELLAQADKHHLKLHPLLLDVTDEAAIPCVLEPMLANGGVYALVHSAGISLRGYFEDCDDDEIRAVLDVNLFGAMAVTRVVLPYMRQAGRGHLIFISSVGGRIASMARTAYCASKFALEGFAESLMQELLPLGIKVSIIEPAIIKTERWTVHRGVARRATSPVSPYRQWFQQEEALADRLAESSPTRPVHVAEQIRQALQSPRPKLRYVVGKRAKLVLRLRRYLPAELFEAIYFREAMRRVTAPPSQTLPSKITTPKRQPDLAVTAQRLFSLLPAIKVLGLPAMLRALRAKRFNDWTIRGYYTTRALISLLNTGFLDEIAARGSVNVVEFATRNNFDLETLQIVVDYLYTQRILDRQNGEYIFDSYGKLFNQTLTGAFHIVHAYEELVENLEEIIRQEKKFNVDVHRNAGAMDIGSGLMGAALAFPYMRAAITQHGFQRVLDIGCGDASFLISLCQDDSQITAYGLDIEPKGILRGQMRIERLHLQDRIALMVGDLLHLGLQLCPAKDSGGAHKPASPVANIDAITMVYVLHELQDQIVPALIQLRDTLPNAALVICEVIRHSPEVLRAKPGGLSEIQFFHDLSNQRLFTREEWQQFFAAAGAVDVQENYIGFVRTSIFTVRWQ